MNMAIYWEWENDWSLKFGNLFKLFTRNAYMEMFLDCNLNSSSKAEHYNNQHTQSKQGPDQVRNPET